MSMTAAARVGAVHPEVIFTEYSRAGDATFCSSWLGYGRSAHGES